MGASVEDVARLRRMTNEPTTTTYSDELLAAYLESWPLVDKNGLTQDNGGTNWIEAYDLHAAAADIWEEKSASYQPKHDFSADGANYSSSQLYETAKTQAAYHRSEQKAQVKKMHTQTATGTYFASYKNPIFDEDETPDWTDPVI